MLFKTSINGWDGWSEIFDKPGIFTPLIREIFAKHKLPFAFPGQLAPGTNAVFSVGNYVVKIFVPDEILPESSASFDSEVPSLLHAARCDFPVPVVTACGCIEDSYLFRYIIYSRIFGENAEKVLPLMTPESKTEFARTLRASLKKLNTVPSFALRHYRDIPLSRRFEELSPTLAEEILRSREKYKNDSSVYVHGDITRDNLMFDPFFNFVLIDFADSCMAPAEYELCAPFFELFLEDRSLISGFTEADGKDAFLEKLMKGLSIHPYCANIIADFCVRRDLILSDITSLSVLSGLVGRYIE